MSDFDAQSHLKEMQRYESPTPVARLRALERFGIQGGPGFVGVFESAEGPVIRFADLDAALVATPEDLERVAFAVFESYWPDQSAQWIREHWATDWDRCRTVNSYKAATALLAMGFTVPE